MTAPFKSKAPSAYAEAIRNEFVSRRLANPVDGLAWGQFLEHVAANGQAGLYGSSSAAIVLKAFGRDLDADASRAHQELVDVWNQRNADVAVADRLKQNPRLIWLFLALSVERSIVNNVAQSVSVEIFARRHAQEFYWSDAGNANDVGNVASEFVSALMVVFLSVAVRLSNQPANEPERARQRQLLTEIRRSADKLQERFVQDKHKVRQYEIVMLTAISMAASSVSSIVRRRFAKYRVNKPVIQERYSHYFDVRRHDGSLSRDYFIVPVHLVGALIAFDPDIRAGDFIYAERIADALAHSLDSSEGLFREGRVRPSTVEQALAVLVLQSKAGPVPSSFKLMFPRLWNFLDRDLEHERAIAWIILLGAVMPLATVASASEIEPWLKPYIPQWLDILLNIAKEMPKPLLAGLTFALGGVGTPKDVLRAAFRRST